MTLSKTQKKALVNKKHLITKESNGIEYYKLQIVQEMKRDESD